MADGKKMSPLISVVIPSWNSAPALDRLLNSLSKQSEPHFEAIVVDRNSPDGTDRVAEKWNAVYLPADMGRSEARNHGASAAKGRYLLFIDADMELSPDVLERCASSVAGFDALCIREKSVSGSNYWARARALERDSFFGTLYYESARFFRKEVFASLGGYEVDMVGFEDLDLQARFLEKGYRLGWADALIYHHEEDVGLVAYLKKRKLYTTTAAIYAQRHSGYWNKLSSVAGRYRLMLRTIGSSGYADALLLVPGLVVMRVLEYIVAKVRTSGLRM